MPRQKPGVSRQDYGTPEAFVTKVLQLLHQGSFDIDLAATKVNRKAERWFGPDRLTGRDALEEPWKQGAGWNWLNPPYAHIAPWVRKAWTEWTDHGARTAVLVPAAVGANWWREWVHEKAHVLLLNGRLTFEGETLPYVKDCALLLYGRNDQQWYRVWNWKTGEIK